MKFLKLSKYKVRKILRKIYHFIGFMSLFILFISPVKADITTCDQYLLSESLSFVRLNRSYIIIQESPFGAMYSPDLWWQQASVTNSTVWYYKVFPSDNIDISSVYYQLRYTYPEASTDQYANTNATCTFSNNIITCSFNSNFNYYFRLVFVVQPDVSDVTLTPINAFVGTPLLFSTNLSDIENCTLIQPESEVDVTYNSFLTVFLDRFEFLASSFVSNPILFTFAGILFTWVILELFLRILHIRGGYKK